MKRQIIIGSMIFVLVAGLAANQAAADFIMDVELDFYTPMGSTVVDDRVYLLTSNAYEPLPEYGGMIMVQASAACCAAADENL